MPIVDINYWVFPEFLPFTGNSPFFSWRFSPPAVPAIMFKRVLLSSYKPYLPDNTRFKPANHDTTSPLLSPLSVDWPKSETSKRYSESGSNKIQNAEPTGGCVQCHMEEAVCTATD